MSDPGPDAAIQRVMGYFGCNPGTRMNIRVCVKHLVPWSQDQCATAEAVARAAREDYPDVVREASEKAWNEAYALSCYDHNNLAGCGEPDSHGHSNANPYRAAAIRGEG